MNLQCEQSHMSYWYLENSFSLNPVAALKTKDRQKSGIIAGNMGSECGVYQD